MSAEIVALVPMRHHSERVPGKNYREFAGKPLFHHIVNALLACPLISRVVIDTDSGEIGRSVLRDFPPELQLLTRPERLRGEMVSMNEVLLYDITQVHADYYVQTHSTNPLLRSETVSRAIRAFQNGYPEYDSLFSVTPIQARLWDGQTRAVNHNPDILLRTQDLPPVFVENSCLYIFSEYSLVTHQSRIGQRPLMFELDRIEAWDIDDETDFKIAELLYGETLTQHV